MTPEEVVARAKELAGKEVLLTVRGVPVVSVFGVRLVPTGKREPARNICIAGEPEMGGRPLMELVDIHPAPIRIESGELYRDASGGLIFEGDDHGMLLRPGVDDTFSPASFPGLQRVKVVPA